MSGLPSLGQRVDAVLFACTEFADPGIVFSGLVKMPDYQMISAFLADPICAMEFLKHQMRGL